MTARGTKEMPAPGPSDDRRMRQALIQIEDALRHLQYGQVTVTVQDGVVVQIERTERHRFQHRSG